MGIANLLPLVRPCMSAFYISEHAGKKVGIDGYGWLYLAARKYARQLLETPEQACHFYISELMERIRLLQIHDMDITVVFDGKALPAKLSTQVSRRAKRAEILQQAKQARAKGDNILANKLYSQSLSVSHRLVSNWIRVLKQAGIKFIVAPYEADAQLALLARTGAIDLVFTDDADLIIYECPNIVFKLDQDGRGDLMQLSKIRQHEPFADLSVYLLRQACILAGCDYFEGINGLGVITAVKQIQKMSIANMIQVSAAKREQSFSINEIFDGYHLAENTFLHQVVYDPTTKSCRRLSEVLGHKAPNVDEDVSYAGVLDWAIPEMVRNICELGVADASNNHVPCQQDYDSCYTETDGCARDDEQVWYRDAILYGVYIPPFRPATDEEAFWEAATRSAETVEAKLKPKPKSILQKLQDAVTVYYEDAETTNKKRPLLDLFQDAITSATTAADSIAGPPPLKKQYVESPKE